MKTIVVGERGYIRRAADTATREEDARFILRGWRKKILFSYIHDVLKDAQHVQPPAKFAKTTPWGWAIRSHWLALLLTFRQMALKTGKTVKVIYGDEVVIEFASVRKDTQPA
jgi:hypothetical protein